MRMKLLRVVFVGLVLSVATAWAGPASIQGIVRDASGQPDKGADVRIESVDGKQLFKTGRSDGTGRHLGGHWVEVDEYGTAASDSNVYTGAGEDLRRQQLTQSPGSVPGLGPTPIP